MYRIGRMRTYAAIIALSILQSTSGMGIRPDLLLIFVIFIGLYSDLMDSLEAGVAAGLLRGAMGTGPVPTELLIFGLCGISASFCKSKIYKDDLLTQGALMAAISLAANMLYLFFFGVTRSFADINLPQAIVNPVALSVLYTSVAAPPAFFIFKKTLFYKRDIAAS